jgi:hypothetical protein
MKPAPHKISVVAAALLWPVFYFAPALADTGIELEDCRITDTSGIRSVSARCGTLRVPENYSDPDGKHIDLFVAVIPALSQIKPNTMVLWMISSMVFRSGSIAM